MLELAFSESVRGSLRCAQHYSPRGWVTRPILQVSPAPAHLQTSLEQVRNRRAEEDARGQALGGDPKDVLSLSFALDIGPISGPVDSPARRAQLDAMFGDARPSHASDAQRHWARSTADLDQLLRRAKAGEKVRIWYSDCPYSLCGYYQVLSLLAAYDCPVTALHLPRWAPLGEDSALSARSWGEISPGDFASYLPLETPVPKPVRRAAGMEWAALQRENAPLRVSLNGRLYSVGEDFYDPFLRRELPAGPFLTAHFIGEVLGRQQLGIGDWLIAQRIRHFLDTGELKLLKEGPSLYRSTLQRQA
jgi:hypothetical protein